MQCAHAQCRMHIIHTACVWSICLSFSCSFFAYSNFKTYAKTDCMEQHNSLVLVWDMQMLAGHIVFIWKHMSVVDRMEWKPQPCWFFKGWLNKITIAYANLLKLHYFFASFGTGKMLIRLFIRRFMLKFDQSLWSLLLLLLLLLPLMVGCKTLVHSLWAYISYSHGLFACLSFQYQRFNELDICNDKNTPTKPQNIDKHIETQRTVPHFRLNMRQ